MSKKRIKDDAVAIVDFLRICGVEKNKDISMRFWKRLCKSCVKNINIKKNMSFKSVQEAAFLMKQ
jgi:predicted phosphoadenosine phosphosulfate sulfurtransferase